MTEVTAEPGPPMPRRGSALSIERLGRRLGIRMTIPAQLLLVFIVTFPALMLIYLSLTWWGPLDGTTWIYAFESLNWFDNYIEIFQDGRLWGSIGRTFLIMAVVVPIEFLLGLGLAVLFVDRFHGKRIFYVVLLMPMMIVPSVAGYMFFMLFQSNGPINQIISGITGLDFDVVWLGHPIRSMIAIMVADIWQWTPLMFLILLAGIISVPEDQLKAATLLGANWAHKFWRIVLPRMKIVMVIALVIRSVEAFKLFDIMWIMTKGGPGYSTETVSVYIYKLTFFDLEWAYVSTAGLVIMIFLSLFAVVGLIAMGRAKRRRLANPG
ncbi:MAG: sugar ABC transporter permease [Rhodospirillales bacterium]|nr:sugar ABC transporter permease [Rhodospirillales bacterium]